MGTCLHHMYPPCTCNKNLPQCRSHSLAQKGVTVQHFCAGSWGVHLSQALCCLSRRIAILPFQGRWLLSSVCMHCRACEQC